MQKEYGVDPSFADFLECYALWIVRKLSFAIKDIEVCTVKISVDDFEAFIIGVYRPVNGRVDSF